VTDLEQINASLQQGPVLMKIGSENCGPCRDMEPILQELATEYGGRAKVVSVDIDNSPQLAAYFGSVYAIPDITVIVNIKDGKYVYMRPDGKVTTDRIEARIIGSQEKGTYEDVLDLALKRVEKNKSQ
jgi:thioredoxin-like negative regulator of GroEL